MVGLVFAMEEEARQVLKEFSFEKVEMRGRTFYVESSDNHNKIIAIISGVGKVNAQIATSILISVGCTRIINIGTCGSMSEKFKPGDLVEPNLFFDGDFDLSSMDTTTKDPALVNREMDLDNPVPCYTYSTFITDERASRGIVDMEAYGVVAHARVFDTPVKVIKIVSDGGDIGEFEDNVNSVIEKHLDYIKRIIKED